MKTELGGNGGVRLPDSSGKRKKTNYFNAHQKKIKDNLFVYSLVIYPLVLFAIFYVAMNFNSILFAFQKIDGTGKTFVGFDNFKNFLALMADDNDVVGISFINSVKMFFINLAICMPLYIVFSYLLFKKCFGNKFVSLLVMIPNIMSGMVIGLLFTSFIGSDGPFTKIIKIFNVNGGEWFSLLYSEKYAFGTCIVYMIWLSFATNLIVYPTSMRGIDPSVLESASMDGVSNMFQELWYIILPLIYPTICTFLILGFAAIFTTSGPLISFYYTSAPPYVYNMGYYFTRQVLVDSTEFSYPLYSAGGLILTVIVAPLTLLLKWALEKFGPTTE